MVNFREIVSAIAENAYASFQVPVLNTKHQPELDLNKLPVLSTVQDFATPPKQVILSSVVAANSVVVTKQSRKVGVAHAAAAAPPAHAAAAAPPAHAAAPPAPAAAAAAAPTSTSLILTVDPDDDENEFVTTPTPTRMVAVAKIAVPTVPSDLPSSKAASTVASTTHSVTAKGPVLDPICIGISVRDHMYEIATSAVRQSIECEEARILESKLDELYKSESGRSRGWTKTHLTEFIVPRAAAGSKVAPKQAFQWSSLRTDKHVSAALDFICLAKGIRLAVWFEDTHEIGIWPAADPNNMVGKPQLFHISGTGQSVGNPRSLVVDGWTIRAAPSVENSLEKLTLGELDNLAEQIGLTGITGKKTDRVRAIASFRTKQRLGV
jgi:hypothetical protein